MIRIKPTVDVIAALKAAGYSTYRLRKEHILAESTIQKFRDGVLPSWNELNAVLNILNLSVADVIEHIPD